MVFIIYYTGGKIRKFILLRFRNIIVVTDGQLGAQRADMCRFLGLSNIGEF